VDCGACVSSASCPDKITPDGKRLKPKGCTSNCLVPTREETTLASPHGAGWENGKVFSCACGGDARTDPFCAYQQDTTFLFHVTAAEDDDRSRSRSRTRTRLFGGASPSSSGSAAAPANLNMHVREYGGIPDTGRPDVPDWKYRYAYAPVWDANFTGCRWRVSECLEPLPASEDCVIYECPGGEVACPPTDVPECPGRNALGCGDGPNGTSAGKYWQHPCNPLVTPQSKGVTFWCPLEPATSDASAASADDGGGRGGRSAGGGAHLCYWTQPGVIPSFAVTCSVGNCLYEETDAGGLSQLCPADFTPAEFWTGDLVTRVAMFCVAAALVLAAALYVRVESQSLYSRKEDLLLLESGAGVPSSAGPRHPGHPRHPHVRTPSTVLDPAGPGPVGERRRRGECIGDAGGSPAGSSRRGSSPPRGMVISWEDVRAYATIVTPYGGTRTKRILRGVSGYAGGAGYAGESAASGGGCSSVHRGGAGLFAILGPSGAGKSTLLDFLAGRTPCGQTARGTVRVDGREASREAMRRLSGYVCQEDVLPGTSTVWEHLLFNAALRMPAGTSNETIRRCAVGWMRELGLVKVAHSRIGDAFTRGLSGGEKRRVSIATELLTSPGLMFLDEPTTGLDSTSAAKVVDILSGLGKMGVTVVLSIHQPRPDIFRLLDRVMVMSGEGRVVYTGPSADAEAHFASLEYVGAARSVRVADYVLDAVLRGSDEDVARMVADFEGSAIHAANEAFAAALRSAAEVKEEERRAEARTSRGRGNAMRAMRDGRTDDAYTPRGDDSDPDRIARADLETSDLAFDRRRVERLGGATGAVRETVPHAVRAAAP
jgi:ABC-type multidrug transport system ATPase subunit